MKYGGTYESGTQNENETKETPKKRDVSENNLDNIVGKNFH
jgi:hypothetical protein